MRVSVAEQRGFINDLAFPPKYSNEEIAKALSDAERHLSQEYRVDFTTVKGERLLRLQASVFLFESPRDEHVGQGAIKKIKDGNGTIEFSERGESHLERYRRYLKDELLLLEDPLEVEYDDF